MVNEFETFLMIYSIKSIASVLLEESVWFFNFCNIKSTKYVSFKCGNIRPGFHIICDFGCNL